MATIPYLSRHSSHGYVYLIKSDSGHYKIGKSKRPDRRAGLFSLQLPFKIEVIHTIKCENYHKAERLFHLIFAEYRVNGEWFLLPQRGVDILLAWGDMNEADADEMLRETPRFLRRAGFLMMHGKEAYMAKYEGGATCLN